MFLRQHLLQALLNNIAQLGAVVEVMTAGQNVAASPHQPRPQAAGSAP